MGTVRIRKGEFLIDKKTLDHVFQESKDYPISSKMTKRIAGSTLDLQGLRFIGSLAKHFDSRYIFEFGSGVSTSFFEQMSGEHHIYSAEDSGYYLQITKNQIGNNERIHLQYCPIRSYWYKGKSFATYDNQRLINLCNGKIFDLVLIDGPLGSKYGREATLYQITPFINKNTLFILDDSNRQGEQKDMANWNRVWKNQITFYHFPDIKKGMSIFQLPLEHPQIFPFSLRDIFSSWKNTKKMFQH